MDTTHPVEQVLRAACATLRIDGHPAAGTRCGALDALHIRLRYLQPGVLLTVTGWPSDPVRRDALVVRTATGYDIALSGPDTSDRVDVGSVDAAVSVVTRWCGLGLAPTHDHRALVTS